MTCPCDTIVFPPPWQIDAGLRELPRQLATFPEWRTSLLSAVAGKPALSGWRARDRVDFGVMLLEMWAYVSDVVSFYDQVIAHEAYLRTARLRPSARKLVGLLGYHPRPAVAAAVQLAVLADGARPVALPAGAAFRSGAFGAEAPQIFETGAVATVQPLANQWTLLPYRPPTMGDGTGTFVLSAFTLATAGLAVAADDVLLLSTPSLTTVRRVTAVETKKGSDGDTYAFVALDEPVSFYSQRLIADVSLTTPAGKASLWKAGTVSGSGDPEPLGGTKVVFDGPNRQVRAGTQLLLSRGSDVRWFSVVAVEDALRTVIASQTSTLKDGGGTVTGSVVSPPVKVPVTVVTLDADVNDPGHRRQPNTWTAADAPNLTVHLVMTPAGRLTRSAHTSLGPGDPLRIGVPVRSPAAAPKSFLLEDRDGDGAAVTGALDFTTGTFTPDAGVSWTPLDGPVRLHGNVVDATRGESVNGELLGSGDASQATRTFTLKKKPLTYLPAPTAANESGLANTLSVWVGGIRWREVASFFGAAPTDEVYVVRHDDDGAAQVIFGGGARPRTGTPIVARYRFGAGAATPPAGSIAQIAKAIPGIKGVRNPVAAFGGADQEKAAEIARLGPRSALLLGRAVSLPDLEVAAAGVPGVRAAAATWGWNAEEQRPVAQIHYVGAAALAPVIRQRLHELTDPTTPIAVGVATASARALSIDVAIDPRYQTDAVTAAVRAGLMEGDDAILSPETVGIGRALFRSVIFDRVLETPGAVAVHALLINGRAFGLPGIHPGTGRYFDFETGGLTISGSAADG